MNKQRVPPVWAAISRNIHVPSRNKRDLGRRAIMIHVNNPFSYRQLAKLTTSYPHIQLQQNGHALLSLLLFSSPLYPSFIDPSRNVQACA